MKKNLISLGFLVLLAALAIFIINIVQNNNRKKDIEVSPQEHANYDILSKAIKNSSYFQDSDMTANKDYTILTIDGKYDITIKNTYYMMTIKDTKDEKVYCQIVDAIETSLGHREGDSIETCTETLAGKINTGHIDAEIYDTYKVLTVNKEEKSALYAPDNSHAEKDLISVDEINYNVKIDDYLLTSMSLGKSKATEAYSVCGHIYNSKKSVHGELTFTLYDNAKEPLDTKTFTYENATKKFIEFCVDFSVDENVIKYYSIAKTETK